MRVESCCCCNLKTGTMVLSQLVLIGSVSCVLTSIHTLATGGGMYGAYLRMFTESPECDSNCQNATTAYFNNLMWSELVWNVIGLVIAAVAIHGVRKSKPSLLLPFLILLGLGIVSLGLLVLVGMLIMIFVDGGLGTGIFIVSGIFFGLEAYFFIVVHSYRMKLTEDEKRPSAMLMESGIEDPPPYYKDCA